MSFGDQIAACLDLFKDQMESIRQLGLIKNWGHEFGDQFQFWLLLVYQILIILYQL